MEKNVHKDHRERMKQKFSANPASITDHELIEILLYYVIRQKNTNEAAHNVLNFCGGLLPMLELDEKKLSKIDGIGPDSARFIKLLYELYIRISKEKLNVKGKKKITRQNIPQILHKLFLGVKDERMVMISVDKNCCYLNEHIISDGNAYSAVIPFKKIVNFALDDNASYIFFAHNHPNNLLVPTKEDIETTRLLCHTLSLIDVPVIEHYIVTEASQLGIISETDYFKH